MDSRQIIINIGKKICYYRELKGFSQTDLAANLNPLSDKTSISRLENGRTNPTVKTLVDICRVLEIDIKDLFD